MRTKVSPLIKDDLRQIGDSIARHNAPRALTFIDELRIRIREIGFLPEAYRLRPELGEGIRLAFFREYAIGFRIFPDKRGAFVRVELVVHGSRDLTGLDWA